MTGERGDKRNTKYLAAGLAGDITGTRIGQHLGAASAGTTRAKGMKAYRASIDNALNIDYKGPLRGPSYVKHGAPTIHGGIAGGLAGGAAATGIYYAYRQSDQSQKNRAASMKAKR
jgi:hypothetical protein